MIFHITTNSCWQKWNENVYFESPTLENDGFLHCCTNEQLDYVLKEYFLGQKDIIVLQIDEKLLEPELLYELSDGDQYFPHIYGKLNKNSIVNINNLTDN